MVIYVILAMSGFGQLWHSQELPGVPRETQVRLAVQKLVSKAELCNLPSVIYGYLRCTFVVRIFLIIHNLSCWMHFPLRQKNEWWPTVWVDPRASFLVMRFFQFHWYCLSFEIPPKAFRCHKLMLKHMKSKRKGRTWEAPGSKASKV